MKEIYLCDDDNAVRCQIQTALERKILAVEKPARKLAQ